MKLSYLVILFMLTLLTACSSKKPGSYILDETDLVPEGISWSESGQKFYLTSIAKSKIISVDKETGRQEDFISSGQYGYLPGAGIYVNDSENLLYALGGNYNRDSSVTSLFIFDLNTKKLIKRYDIPVDGNHFLNDMIPDTEGNLYITDSKTSSLYLLEKVKDQPVIFFRSDEIPYPNGIAISGDNSKLFVASSKGVRIIDIKTLEVLNEADTAGLSAGIDGLEFYRNNLYAVQNGVPENGYNFRKLELNKTMDQITGIQVIDNKNLNLPLTFCIADDQAVVIANSNLQFLDQENFTFPQPDSLKKTVLMVYDLK